MEAIARAQRWDEERPWRPRTHLWLEEALLVVDLHDLGAKGSKALVAIAIALARDPGLDSGAICFVTGRGRRSRGKPVLGELVGRRLLNAAGDEEEWSVHPLGAGRVALVTDPSKAPARASNRLGLGFWFLAALMAAAALWACMGTPGVD